MTEDQRGSWLIRGMQVGLGLTVRGVDCKLDQAGW
jgi:hypothetical protein